jgi:hypothetical protein
MRRNFKIQKGFICLIMRRNGEGEADNKKITGLQPKLNLRLGMSFLEIVRFV